MAGPGGGMLISVGTASTLININMNFLFPSKDQKLKNTVQTLHISYKNSCRWGV